MHRHPGCRRDGRGGERRFRPTGAEFVVVQDCAGAERRVVEREVLHRPRAEQGARVARHPEESGVGEVPGASARLGLGVGDRVAVHVGSDLFFRGSFGVEDERVVVPFAGGGTFEEDGVDGGAASEGGGEVRAGGGVGVDEEPAGVFVEVGGELQCEVVVGAVGTPLHPELDRELVGAGEVDARACGAREPLNSAEVAESPIRPPGSPSVTPLRTSAFAPPATSANEVAPPASPIGQKCASPEVVSTACS